MIRTIIVDDEPRGLNMLKKLLQEYCPDLNIIAECGDAESAKAQIMQLGPQLVFLDISLPGKTSFDMLAELGNINFEIIFVTAHNQYTLQAFRYSAVDYLVKPVDEDLLIDAVSRTVKRIRLSSKEAALDTLLHNIHHTQSPGEMKLCISSLKGFTVVPVNTILYFEASGSYTNIFFADGTSTCSTKPIYQYDETLAEAGFIRVHKSYLVNIAHIKEYVRGEGGTVILTNGAQVEVSRRKKEELLSLIRKIYRH